MRLTVVDATSVKLEDRRPLLDLARRCHALSMAIVFDLPEEVCCQRNRERPDRVIGPHVAQNHRRALERSIQGLPEEGFCYTHVLRSEEEVSRIRVERVRLRTDRKDETGPFDIIGDIHGCFDELAELMGLLGYRIRERVQADGLLQYDVTVPRGRKVVFLGDLVDRGPRIPQVLRLVMGMVREGKALCVPGNHDVKLLRKLRGKYLPLTHGLAESVEQLEGESSGFIDQVIRFIDSLVTHYVLDGGRLVVAHAGMKEEFQGRTSGMVRSFALYGETTGEIDEFGLPIRLDWAADYNGQAMVVYGHTPVYEPVWQNNTINIDTGCVFGGRLSALRYPEMEIVSVPARAEYTVSKRPLVPGEAGKSPQRIDP